MRRTQPSAAELRRGEQLCSPWPAAVADAPRPRMRLLAWRPIDAGSLVGTADVELAIGLKLFGIAVLRGSSGLWAALPNRPQLNREKRQRVGADGKPVFAAIAEWRSRELSDRFSAAVVGLVREAHPGDLDGAGQ
jgi:hypothetical protein